MNKKEVEHWIVKKEATIAKLQKQVDSLKKILAILNEQ
jgi:hypothetical protein